MARSEGKVNYWSLRVDTTKGPWYVTTILLLGQWRPRGSSLAFTGIRALKAEVSSDKSVTILEDGQVLAREQVWIDMGYTPEQYREARRLAEEKYGARTGVK